VPRLPAALNPSAPPAHASALSVPAARRRAVGCPHLAGVWIKIAPCRVAQGVPWAVDKKNLFSSSSCGVGQDQDGGERARKRQHAARKGEIAR